MSSKSGTGPDLQPRHERSGRRSRSRRGTGPRCAASESLSQVTDQEFSEIFLSELLRRRTYGGVVGQIHAAMKAVAYESGHPMRTLADPRAVDRREAVADAAHDAVMRVPHVGSTEAGHILADRGVLVATNHADALRKLAQDGRLIGLRDGRKWVYPSFQLNHFDPRDSGNIIVVINRQLDAARFPESAVSWWTTPSGSLPDDQAPADLLGSDEHKLRQLADAYAAGPDL